jgi:CheY-like chemotaxis protein
MDFRMAVSMIAHTAKAAQRINKFRKVALVRYAEDGEETTPWKILVPRQRGRGHSQGNTSFTLLPHEILSRIVHDGTIMKTDDTRIYSVVVVDDCIDFRVGLLDLLASIPGIRVAAAGANERDAIVLSALHEPDILLIDSGMPAYGAVSCARTVKERTPGTYIVLMTSNDVRDFDMLHDMTRADGIISKSNMKSGILMILSEMIRDTAGHAN